MPRVGEKSAAIRAKEAEAVRKWRERNPDYQKKYNKAVALATRRLRERHEAEYGVLLSEARKEVGV